MAADDSKLSICSEANQLLGGKALTALTGAEIPPAARFSNAVYDDVRDSAIGMYPWSFSFTRVRLSQLSSLDAVSINSALHPIALSTGSRVFTLPSNRINNVWAVFNTTDKDACPIAEGWTVFGDYLISDYKTIIIEYQYRTPEAYMPPFFVQLLKYMMAWNIAEAVTDQLDKAKYYKRIAVGTEGENMRGGFFRLAAFMDSQNRQTKYVSDDSLLRVRL